MKRANDNGEWPPAADDASQQAQRELADQRRGLRFRRVPVRRVSALDTVRGGEEESVSLMPDGLFLCIREDDEATSTESPGHRPAFSLPTELALPDLDEPSSSIITRRPFSSSENDSASKKEKKTDLVIDDIMSCCHRHQKHQEGDNMTSRNSSRGSSSPLFASSLPMFDYNAFKKKRPLIQNQEHKSTSCLEPSRRSAKRSCSSRFHHFDPDEELLSCPMVHFVPPASPKNCLGYQKQLSDKET
jgi:hypothetical protein